jgi:hypothetical protein
MGHYNHGGCCGNHHHDHSHQEIKIKAITKKQKIQQLKEYKKTLSLEMDWVEERIKTLESMK